eukprot:155155-Heterocapsa_arctica.AAC.1
MISAPEAFPASNAMISESVLWALRVRAGLLPGLMEYKGSSKKVDKGSKKVDKGKVSSKKVDK